MTRTFSARLGSITFDDSPDLDGDRFKIAEIDGWESPELEISSGDKHGDGSTLERIKYGPRNVILSGHGISETAAGVWRVRKKLAAASNLVRSPGTLYVDEDPLGAPAQAEVYRSAELRLRPDGPYAVEFEIPLRAYDPRKYSQTEKSQTVNSTTATVTNDGNYPTFVRAVLNTVITAPMLRNDTDGAKQVTMSGSIAAGVTLNMAKRTLVTAGGTNIYGSIVSTSKWWELLDGDNTIVTTGDWTLYYRDAFI